MTELVRPDLGYHASWAAAVAEFLGDGSTMHGSGLWDLDTSDLSEQALKPKIDRLMAQADPDTVLRENWVHCTHFWIVDGAGFVGYLALRHALTPFLFEEGGHIGFSVRPSRRREGHATRALALALPQAAELGLDRVLLTCDDDNEASRRTIEGNGGVYEDSRKGKRRYWIDLG
jgi:predicted acetyltransferase